MYLQYYRLTKSPFHVTPDPEFLFLSETHKECLASIIYGVTERKGFVAITGEVGVGKTTVVRAFLEQVDREQIRPVYVFNPNLTFDELLRFLCRDLDLTPETDETSELVNALHRHLIDLYSQNRNVVLVIDEAQNIPFATLENLRMLSNLETHKDKLIQIILVGQTEFEEMLNRPELRQLKQRIAVFSRIVPLNEEESLAYIQHRLAKSGGARDRIFTRQALNRIIRQSRGIPRLINILCDNCLNKGFGYQKNRIGAGVVKEVVAEMKGTSRRSVLFRRLGIAAGVLGVLFFLGLAVYEMGYLTAMRETTQEAMVKPKPLSPARDAPGATVPEATASRPDAGAPLTAAPPSREEKKPKPEQAARALPVPTPTPARPEDLIAAKGLNGPAARPEMIATDRGGTGKEAPATVAVPSPPASVQAVSEVPSPREPKASSPEPKGAGHEPRPASPGTRGAAQESKAPVPERKASAPESRAPATSELAVLPVAPAAPSPEPRPASALPPAAVAETRTVPPQTTAVAPEPRIAPAEPKPSRMEPVFRTAKRGDTLSDLIVEVYGAFDRSLLDLVKRSNPHIRDENHILVGERITFPPHKSTRD